MKRNRKIIRYSAQYSKKAKAKRLVLRSIVTVVVLAALISLGFIITGYIVDNDFHPFQNMIDAYHANKTESSEESKDDSDAPSDSESSDVPDDSSDTSSDGSSDTSSEQEPQEESLSAALLMSNDTILSDSKRAAFLADAKANGYTAVIIEVKNTKGNVLYNTENALAAKSGAVSAAPFDLQTVVDDIHAAGMQVIAKMSTLQDPITAHVDYGTSYKYGNTDYTWLDDSASRGGKAWMNPYLENSRTYLSDLTAELAHAGCDVILADDMIYPTKYTSKLNQGSTSVSRQEMLSQLYSQMEAAANGKKVVFCIDAESYFGKNENRYNGTPDGIKGLTYVCPIINLSVFSDIESYDEALTDVDFSTLTAQNIKLILNKVQSAHPDAAVIPMFAADMADDALIDVLKDYGITQYLCD